MDENLNWKSETAHVANKVSKCIGIIVKSSFYFLTLKEHLSHSFVIIISIFSQKVFVEKNLFNIQHF